MNKTLDALVQQLNLEQIEENIFRGKSEDLGLRQLFGGQVLGQALSGASKTVEDTLQVHSLHGYFLRPGDASLPVIYHVDRVRDGRSFSTRRVSAIQKGQTIFTCIASFQPFEDGLSHTISMPDVPGPEELVPEFELSDSLVESQLPLRIRESIAAAKPIEIRSVSRSDSFSVTPTEPKKYVWFKANGRLPNDQALHKYILAYASDFELLTTSLLPHAVSIWQPFMQIASLDHAIWFHDDVKVDDWLLYATDSPWANNSRGYARGHIFNRAGKLVASTAQEGLIRVREDWR